MAHDAEFQRQLDYQARVDALNSRNAVIDAITSVTGAPPTEDQIQRFMQYSASPGTIQAILGKEMLNAPIKGTYTDTINKSIMGILGRPATESEVNYFGKQMEQGNLDPYGLESFIKGQEEYQTGYARKAREELKTELGESDQAYLNKVQKSLQAKYASQGRPNAGAFGSAMIQAGKDLAAERGQYLAGIGYESAKQGGEILRSGYAQSLNDLYNRQGYSQGLASEMRNRYYSQQDAANQYRNQRDLMALQNYYFKKNQPTFMEGMLPGLLTAGATVLSGPIGGALVGAGTQALSRQNQTTYPNLVQRYY